MARLGFVYANGERGFARNDREAFGFFKRSADAGYPQGQAKAGYHYLTGRGVDRNEGLGMYLLLRGAERGSAMGCDYLGKYFEKGAHGLPKDPQEAATWHNRAAVLRQQAEQAAEAPRQPSIIFADNRLQDALGRIAARASATATTAATAAMAVTHIAGDTTAAGAGRSSADAAIARGVPTSATASAATAEQRRAAAAAAGATAIGSIAAARTRRGATTAAICCRAATATGRGATTATGTGRGAMGHGSARPSG